MRQKFHRSSFRLQVPHNFHSHHPRSSSGLIQAQNLFRIFLLLLCMCNQQNQNPSLQYMQLWVRRKFLNGPENNTIHFLLRRNLLIQTGNSLQNFLQPAQNRILRFPNPDCICNKPLSNEIQQESKQRTKLIISSQKEQENSTWQSFSFCTLFYICKLFITYLNFSLNEHAKNAGVLVLLLRKE